MQLEADRIQLSPSDVTAYLACEHLTTLSIRAARGELERPARRASRPSSSSARGASTSRRTSSGYAGRASTFARSRFDESDFERAAEETEQAVETGVDVVYQGVLLGDGWRGVADFLERQPDGTYEAVDTKLARSAKPAYILQLCFYSEQLARLQGREPEQIHVLLGNGRAESFRPQRVRRLRAARPRAARGVRRRAAARPSPTRVDHCGICDFKPLCDAWWDEVDHLCRVAGLYRTPDREARAPPGSRRSPRSRRRPRRRPASTRTRSRSSAARPGSSSTAVGRTSPTTSCSSRSREPASRSYPTRRPATSSSTSRATRSGTSRARSSTSGACSTSDGAFEPPVGRRPRVRAARARDSSSTASTRGSPSTPTCTSTTTRATRSPRSAG